MNKTRIFLGVALVCALGWEGLALAGVLGPHATISEGWWAIIEKFPLANLLFGILIGHLSWQRQICRHCGERPW